MTRRLPLWQNAAWLRRQIDGYRDEADRLRRTFRYRLGRAVLDFRRHPLRSSYSIARALRDGRQPMPADLAAGQMPPAALPDDSREHPALLRAELQAVIEEVESLTRSREMRLGGAVAALAMSPWEVARRWREGEHASAGDTRGPDALHLEPAANPATRVAIFGPRWLEDVFAAEGATGEEARRGAELVVAWGRDGFRDELAAARSRGATVARWTDDGGPTPADVDVHFTAGRGSPAGIFAGPAIQPRAHNPIGWWQRGEGWRAASEAEAPESWRTLFDAARTGDGGSSLSSLAPGVAALSWDGGERLRFARLRTIHRDHSAARRLAELGAAAGIAEPEAPVVSACLCTNRPDRLLPAVETMLAQSHPALEIVVVAHGRGFDPGPVRELCAERGVPLVWDNRPPHYNLGMLRAASHEVAGGEWFAKFDDDDHYGPGYIADSLWQAAMADASAVVKQNSVFELEGFSGLYLGTQPELLYHHSTGGGTMVIERSVARAIPFRPVPTAEDTLMVFDLARFGIPMLAGDHYNYVYRRGAGERHTWRIDPGDLVHALGLHQLPEPARLADLMF